MSDTARFATARKTSRATLLITWLNGATLTLYAGTVPASADTAISDQVALAEFTLPNPSGSVTDGAFTLASGTDPATVLADGTPSFGRITDSVGATVGDFDAGATGSGAALILDNTSLITGALVSVLSFTLSEA